MNPTPEMVPGDLLESGLWLSVSDLARRKGVSKQSISERLAKLVAAGLVETKPGKGRARLVNVAQYDRAVGQIGDPAKEAGAATKRELAGETDSLFDAEPRHAPGYRDAKADDARYSAELKRLELEERLGKLVRADEVSDAIMQAARTVRQVVERLPLRAAELAAAVGKDGEVGARGVLKAATHDILAEIADALEALAAPPVDGTVQ